MNDNDNIHDNKNSSEENNFFINISPELIKSLNFIIKFANKITVNENSISSSNLTIQIQNLSNCNIGIKTKDFIDMIKNIQHETYSDSNNNTVRFTIINNNDHVKNIKSLENDKNEKHNKNNNLLVYKYKSKSLSEIHETKNELFFNQKVNLVVITKYIELFDLNYKLIVNQPKLVLRIKEFKVISSDETFIKYENNKLLLETFKHIKTRNILKVEKIEGFENNFSVKVRGDEIKIIQELEGERLLCYHDDCLVFYGIEDKVTTAGVIKLL